MSTLKQQPRTFDSLRNLSVWTVYGEVMRKLHDCLNGQGCLFMESSLWTMRDRGAKPYTIEEILGSLQLNSPLSINISDGHNNYGLVAPVVSATVVTATTLILVFDGMLERFHGGDHTLQTEAKVVCCYNLSDGRGFCLVPEHARALLWSN